MKKLAIVAAVLVVSGSMPYSPQGTTDLLAAVHLAAVQQVEGQRADIDQGQAAPFDGVLLDAVALDAVRGEVSSLRGEIASLRAALDVQKQATEVAQFRAELWQAEATPSAWGSLARYACSASVGAVIAGIVMNR
tara:strand:- start:46 stop:450 length:405 start_codon:yes stop_codon:yes gene_type:complete